MQAGYAKKLSWRVASKADFTFIVKSVGKDINWRVYTIYFCAERNVDSEFKIEDLKR